MASNKDNKRKKQGFAAMRQDQIEAAGRKGGSANTPDQMEARRRNVKKAQDARRNS